MGVVIIKPRGTLEDGKVFRPGIISFIYCVLIQAAEKEEMQRGAIYLGQIPHGFYENEMKGYFSQFGKITRLKLFRSRKVYVV